MPQNKLSRRDTIKLLGAAIGGAALSTIPPKWSKPALAASQLPEHARQSTVSAGAAACPIVRTAFVGNVTALSPGYYPFTPATPITDADIAACAFTRMTISWTGAVPAGGAGGIVALARSVGVAAFTFIFVPTGTPSPAFDVDPNLWTGSRPYNGLSVLTGVGTTWNVGTLTVTLS